MEIHQRIADQLTKHKKLMTESNEGIPNVGDREVYYIKNPKIKINIISK